MPWDDKTDGTSKQDAKGPWGGGGSSGGGGGDRGPWGGGGNGGGRGNGGGNRGGGQQPPDIDELLRQGQERLRTAFGGGGKGGSSGGGAGLNKNLVGLVLVGLVVVWLLSGFYRVNADEQGVVLRFGQFVETTQPGLNYHLPAPIETAMTPKTETVQRIDVGFGAAARGASSDRIKESLMLTGDENIVDIDFSVLWKISDAGAYLFNLQNPELVVKAVAESVMREVIGRNEIALILTEKRKQIEDEVRISMQQVLDEYGAGVLVREVQLRKVDPPAEVIDSFRDVQAAQADAERERNKADAYARDIVPRARGEAERIIQAAKGYKESAIAQAEGEAARFLSVYGEYRNAKDVTRNRMFLETMEDVLGDMDKIIISGDGGVVPYLPLDQLNKKGGK